MNTRDHRLDKEFDKVVQELLQQGTFPSVYDVAARVAARVTKEDLDLPSMKPYLAYPNEKIDYNAYNKMMADLIDDLSVLYSVLLEIKAKALNSFTTFDIEVKQQEAIIAGLEKRIRELILTNSAEGLTGAFVEDFSTSVNIDTSATSANVNTQSHEVTLPKIQSSEAIITEPCEISVSVDNTRAITSQIGSTAISEVYNSTDPITVWQYQIACNSQAVIPIYIEIDYHKAIVANQIVVDMLSVKPTMVRVEFKPKSIDTWYPVPYNESATTCDKSIVVKFPSMEIASLRLILYKEEADKLEVSDNQPNYLYIYGIKNISVYSTTYTTKAVIQSKPIAIAPGIISISTDEDIPDGCNINYSIALEEPELTWNPISPVGNPNPRYSKTLDLSNVITSDPPSEFAFPNGVNPPALHELATNGINFYELPALDNSFSSRNIIDGSEMLFRGKNAWLVEVASSSTSGIPNNSLFAQADTSYLQHTAGAQSISGSYEHPVRLSCAVYHSKPNTGMSKLFSTNCPAAVYVNGVPIFSTLTPVSNVRVEYPLRNGWNTIAILVNCNADVNLNLSFDPTSEFRYMFASNVPMTKVSLYDLQHNIMNYNHDCYAITQLDGNNVAILNHTTDSSLVYSMFYRYIGTSSSQVSIILRAVLSSDNSSITPTLRKYIVRSI